MQKDTYQIRYQTHQVKKKKELTGKLKPNKNTYSKVEQKGFLRALANRQSQRIFSGEPIPEEVMNTIDAAMCKMPSSCNRQAVSLKWINDRSDKEILSGLLVGGIGWINRADKIILLFADPVAYKAPGEIKYMPYLDAGVIIEAVYLLTEMGGVGCCYVNPNIREENKQFFKERFGKQIFCGAIILGNK